MRLPLKVAAIIAALAALPLLMAPTGGLPFFPQFGGVGIGATPPTNGSSLAMGSCTGMSGPPGICLAVGAGSAAALELGGNGNTTYQTNTFSVQQDSSGNGLVTNRQSGGNTTLGCTGTCTLNLNGTTVATSATTVPWPAQTSGSFTNTLSTGCTTSPTMTVNWVKTGTIVTLYVITQTNFNCTSNTTTKQTDASLPAAIRPSSTRCVATMAGEDNTVATILAMQVTSAGALQWGRENTGTGASNCGGPNATNAGTFAVDSFSATYATN